MVKQIIPHLTVKNCKEAIEFYQSVLGGEVKRIELADGHEMFKGHEGKYIHAELHLPNGQAIYMNDVLGQSIEIGNQIEISLALESEEEIKEIFNRLQERGQVKMPLDKMFWGAFYAKVSDHYGITWELNYQLEN